MGLLLKYYFFLKNEIRNKRLYYRIKRWTKNGLEIGDNVSIHPTVYIDDEYPYLIKIGNNCSFGPNVFVLAHDATTFKFTGGYTKLSKVIIHDNVFVGTNAIILPGCTIGPNALIAAGSVVNKSIPPNTCNAGVPARTYQPFDEFIKRHIQQLSTDNIIDYKELNGENSLKARQWVLRVLNEKGTVYVKRYVGRTLHTFAGRDFK